MTLSQRLWLMVLNNKAAFAIAAAIGALVLAIVISEMVKSHRVARRLQEITATVAPKVPPFMLRQQTLLGEASPGRYPEECALSGDYTLLVVGDPDQPNSNFWDRGASSSLGEVKVGFLRQGARSHTRRSISSYDVPDLTLSAETLVLAQPVYEYSSTLTSDRGGYTLFSPATGRRTRVLTGGEETYQNSYNLNVWVVDLQTAYVMAFRAFSSSRDSPDLPALAYDVGGGLEVRAPFLAMIEWLETQGRNRASVFAGRAVLPAIPAKVQIERLMQLRDQGTITEDQFEEERAKVLLAPAF